MTTPDDTELIDLIPPEAELVRRIVDEVRRYPRIRRPLLRFLTADDFDELIAAVRQNSDNINLILERVGVIERQVQRIPVIEERLTSVEESVQRIPVIEERLTSMDQRLTSVEESVQHIPVIEERLTSVEGELTSLAETVRRIDGNVRSLQGSVGQLRGDSYEARCREQIDAVLDGHMSGAVLADREHINTLLRAARHADSISRSALIDGYNADIIAHAMHDGADPGRLAVVEASVTFNRQDIENASRRAALIAGVTGTPTAAYLVTHHDWPADMDDAARESGVTIIQYALPQYAAEE